MTPRLVCAQDGVEGCDELSHDRDDGDLWLFSGLDEALFEGCHDRVVITGDEGGHVGDVADRLAAAEDAPSAFEGSALAIERSDPDQRGGLAVRQRAEFGHQGEQGVGEDRADPRDRAQQGVPARHRLIAGDGLGDGLVEQEDVGLEAGGVTLVAAPDERLGGVFGVVGAAGEIVAQLAPGGDQLGERLDGGIGAAGSGRAA